MNTSQADVQPASSANTADLKILRRKASLIQFLRDPVAFFRSISDHDGSLTEISLGGQKFFVLTDPLIIRDMLSTRGLLFEKFPQGNPKQQLFGKGLLTSEGLAQKQQRRMMLPGFHRDRLQNYADQMVASVLQLTQDWHSGHRVNITSALNDITLEIIGQTLLGVHNRQVMNELGAQLHTMLNLANRFVVPWGEWLMKLPIPSTLRYRKAALRLNEMVFHLIQAERPSPRPDNLITILLNSAHADASPLTDIEIRDEIVTMIVAGHETVAVGLTWTLFLLATHPTMQDQLAQQIHEAIGNRPPTADDYTRLEFLQHAFAEALRLHPPIWILGRRNLEDYTFRNFTAAKGSIFLVCMADLHRRAALFQDPDTFRPQRWNDVTWPAYAYIPFGGGERRCIGERFAWMEAVLILATLLQRWCFSTSDTQPPISSAQLTLHPKEALWMTCTERYASAT